QFGAIVEESDGDGLTDRHRVIRRFRFALVSLQQCHQLASDVARLFFILRCCTKFSMHLRERLVLQLVLTNTPTQCRDGITCLGHFFFPFLSLIGRRLRDRRDVQMLHSRTGVERILLGESGVDDGVADAVDGDRRLDDVPRQNRL
ncbi:hypothetical protein PENTCL1PPCAC_9151, partial [Pristionchus entomophagus]